MISAITQIVLPQPDMSCRRNRSPNTVISNQNHSTKINIEKTSARKLGKVKPPGNNIVVLRLQNQVPGTGPELNLQFLQIPPELLQVPPAKPLPWSRRTSCAARAAGAAQCREHFIGLANQQEEGRIA